MRPVADPDLVLRGEGGGERGCFACPADFKLFCDFFFYYPK